MNVNNNLSSMSSINNPRYSPWIERNKVKNLSSLSYEESAVLEEVKKMISQLGDPSVKVQVTNGEKQSNGMTIGTTGFMGSGIHGTYDFSLDTKTLKKMAEDENFKTEMFSKIQDYINQEKENQRQFAKVKSEMPKCNPHVYMDFWNDKKDSSKSALQRIFQQAMQSMAERYESQTIVEVTE